MSNLTPNRRRRLHIVGCHRSGTTLLMELLWHCFRFGGRTMHEVSVFEPIPAGEGIYLTKKPPDTNWIEPVFLEDEELFVIAMQRDPRAVITSIHASEPDNYFRSFHVWQSYDAAIGRLADHPRFLTLRFEDLLRDPTSQQRLVRERFSFLEQTGAFEDYPEGFDINWGADESLNGVRPFDTARIDGWRAHLPRIKSQLAQYPQLAAAVTRLGYEPNDDWLTDLESVTPHVQTYKEKRPGWFRRLDTTRRYRRKIARYRSARGLRR